MQTWSFISKFATMHRKSAKLFQDILNNSLKKISPYGCWYFINRRLLCRKVKWIPRLPVWYLPSKLHSRRPIQTPSQIPSQKPPSLSRPFSPPSPPLPENPPGPSLPRNNPHPSSFLKWIPHPPQWILRRDRSILFLILLSFD